MKLLKCLVDNIVVDISFDMLGGISTVCFLESIDRFIRKEHLFKRSIILVSSLNVLHARLACYTCILQTPSKSRITHTRNLALVYCGNQSHGISVSVACSLSFALLFQEVSMTEALLQVKAWCYYESRLLGAHHSLLSTYALETMVLYIFNMYCKELSSPLKVSIASLPLHMLQVLLTPPAKSSDACFLAQEERAWCSF